MEFQSFEKWAIFGSKTHPLTALSENLPKLVGLPNPVVFLGVGITPVLLRHNTVF